MANNSIKSVCTAWRRGIRQIWQLPYNTHSSLLPGLSDILPLIDLFHKRMLNFIYQCLCSHSPIVNFIARHGILFGRMKSTICRNVMSSCERYFTSIDSIIDRTFSVNKIDRVVKNVSDEVFYNVNMLRELICCRDGTLRLSNTSFNSEDIAQLISLVCTP